jgi:hypothetical protein
MKIDHFEQRLCGLHTVVLRLNNLAAHNKRYTRATRASSDSFVLNLQVLCFVGSSVGGGPRISSTRYWQPPSRTILL